MIRSELLLEPAAAARNAVARGTLGGDITGNPPIFLHTGWRTRGTWIWSRFRALPNTTCFYEPLIESLATLSPAEIEATEPAAWPSGHPVLRRPYYAEFRPMLLRAGCGVAGYDEAFATQAFFADPDAAMPRLRNYIALLLQVAHAGGNQPVLKFCRSLGRIGWMQQNFPQAVHIAVARNPLSQFVSAQRHLRCSDNAYFLAMPLLLLARHREQSDIARIIRRLDVALPSVPARMALREGLAVCTAHLRRSDPADWYRAFLAFWTASAASIPPTIDLVIDSDLLNNKAGYRHQCEIDLAALTGQSVDLSDARGGVEQDARMVMASGLRATDLWAAHHAAAGFLAESAGDAWMNAPVLARVAAMLGYAMLLGSSQPHASGSQATTAWPQACSRDAELAAVYASRSWRITAPLRWLGAHRPGRAQRA